MAIQTDSSRTRKVWWAQRPKDRHIMPVDLAPWSVTQAPVGDVPELRRHHAGAAFDEAA